MNARDPLLEQRELDEFDSWDWTFQRELDAEERRLERGDAYTELIRPARQQATPRDVIATGLLVIGAGLSIALGILALLLLMAVTT